MQLGVTTPKKSDNSPSAKLIEKLSMRNSYNNTLKVMKSFSQNQRESVSIRIKQPSVHFRKQTKRCVGKKFAFKHKNKIRFLKIDSSKNYILVNGKCIQYTSIRFEPCRQKSNKKFIINITILINKFYIKTQF